MKFLVLLISLLFVSYSSSAQELYDDYRLYKLEQEEWNEYVVSSDTTLFYRLQQTQDDLYEHLSAYKFSFVESSRRGQYYTTRESLLDGIHVRAVNLPILKRLGLSRKSYSGIASGSSHIVGSIAGMDDYSAHHSIPLDGVNVAAFFSGKGYLGGARATLNTSLGKGWSTTLYASVKGGDDLYVKGVYHDALDLALRLGKEYESGANLSFVALSTLSERGLRSGTTQEVFTLRGDRLYNPTWGHQMGKVRNSRTRKDQVPFIAMSYSQPLGSSTQMIISMGGNYGQREYGNLGWYDAMTPRPDNYRYLPSYYYSEPIASAVEDAWRRGDEEYTQVNWTELYNQNRISSSGAVYALEGRVERVADAELSLGFHSDLNQSLRLDYGLRVRYDNSRNFKRVKDLLGALYLQDLDYFLLDDDTYSSALQNNLLTPNRKVGVGDRFSYDYSLERIYSSFEASLHYAKSRWIMDVGLSAAKDIISRKGYFEKELYKGSASYGRSSKLKFTPYVVNARLGYSFSPKHFADVGVMVSDVTPAAENLFHNPQYNNRVVDNPEAEHRLSAEINYRYTSDKAQLMLSAYMLSKTNQRRTIRAYDDLSAIYCDVDIVGLGELFYGVESAARLKLATNLDLNLAAAYGEGIYSHNPYITHYDDRSGRLISSSESYMGDCHVGGVPRFSAMAELTYFTYRGWVASCSVQGVMGRYVDASVIRRTERVAHQASFSPEIYRSFIAQSRLSDAVTMDASVSRWFNLGRGRLSLTLSVRNLLGNCGIEYGGYEQSRIRNYQSGENRIFMPMDDIVTYAYGRSYYAVISFKL